MTARPHGNISVTVEDFLVVAKYSGNINLESMLQGVVDLKAAINAFNGHAFVMLVDDLNVEGATPEAFEELDRFNAWMNTKNMVAKAMLIHSTVMLKIIDKRVTSRKHQNIQSFDERSEALAWLDGQLAAAP